MLDRDPRMPRVLQVITDTNRRGAQIFACDLESHLARRGVAIRTVAMLAGRRGAQLELPYLGKRRGSLNLHAALRREMRSVDIVIAHGSATLMACVTAGLGLRHALVYRNISDPAYWLGKPSRRLRVRALLSRAELVVALWPGGADFLGKQVGVDRARIQVIPNGVRSANFRPPTSEERITARQGFGLNLESRVLLFVAAMQPEKHPDIAVRAMELLPANFTLLMLGDGPLFEQVADLAGRVAPGRVCMVGQIESPELGFWAADVMVLPSEGEGLPAALIEAGLCGIPAVASTSGGNEDIVIDGRTGAIIEPASPDLLAQAVQLVIDQVDGLGEAARRHCLERYDMTRVADQWLATIYRLLRTDQSAQSGNSC